MMLNKIPFLTVTLFFTLAATAAETKLEMPLIGEMVVNHDTKVIKLASLNNKLKAKGIAAFPETIRLGISDFSSAIEIAKRTEAAGKVLGKEITAFAYGHYGFYMFETPAELCYRGKAADVLPTIKALMGVVFEEDQGIQAVRYADRTYINPDYKNDFFGTNPEIRAEDAVSYPGILRMWDSYKKSSSTVLIISDLGPQGDGTELYATEIKPCR